MKMMILLNYQSFYIYAMTHEELLVTRQEKEHI